MRVRKTNDQFVLWISRAGARGRGVEKDLCNSRVLSIYCSVQQDFEMKLYVGCKLVQNGSLGPYPGVSLPTILPRTPAELAAKEAIAKEFLEAGPYVYMHAPLTGLYHPFVNDEE